MRQESHPFRLGYWPHKGLDVKIKGPHFSIARGFFRIDRKGEYSFRTTGQSLLKVDDTLVYRDVKGEENVALRKILEPGTYPIEVTFLDTPRTNLTHHIWDVPGTLTTLVKEEGEFPYLLDEAGEWRSRDDVWYKGVVTAGANKWLASGCGASGGQLGPELGFGHKVGDHHEAPVLLLKASQGNRSLIWDFLPPGSERFEHTDAEGTTWVYAGYKDTPSRWVKGTEPEPVNWYAGKQYDECFNAAKEVLANFDKNFPHWAGRGYEIAGFAWWQGHKDGGEDGKRPAGVPAQRYEHNLAYLIQTLRKEFNAPEAPFVVATCGFNGGKGWAPGSNADTVFQAQMNISDPERHPEFKGTVRSVDTRPHYRPAEVSPRSQSFHYHQNAGTYMDVGEAMGDTMVELQKNTRE